MLLLEIAMKSPQWLAYVFCKHHFYAKCSGHFAMTGKAAHAPISLQIVF